MTSAVIADVTVEEVCEQVQQQIVLYDAIHPAQRARGITPARIVQTLFRILRARRRNGLPPYSEVVIHDVIWTLTGSER